MNQIFKKVESRLLLLSLLLAPPAMAGQGWYLLRSDGQSKPLGTWYQDGAYDTAKACETARVETLKSYKDKAKGQKYWEETRCIASDDPRLLLKGGN